MYTMGSNCMAGIHACMYNECDSHIFADNKLAIPCHISFCRHTCREADKLRQVAILSTGQAYQGN